jgi:DNA-binding MarR family transcriptional regulator
MKHYDERSYTVENSVGYLMRRGAALMREELEAALAGHGFTFVQWVTLMRVRDKPTLTAGDLCRDLHHDSGAFTRVLDHLEDRHLIRRARSDTDRRVMLLHLTDDGRKTVKALLPIVVERLNYALEPFTAAEVETLAMLLRRLTARLENADADCATAARKAQKP